MNEKMTNEIENNRPGAVVEYANFSRSYNCGNLPGKVPQKYA